MPIPTPTSNDNMLVLEMGWDQEGAHQVPSQPARLPLRNKRRSSRLALVNVPPAAGGSRRPTLRRRSLEPAPLNVVVAALARARPEANMHGGQRDQVAWQEERKKRMTGDPRRTSPRPGHSLALPLAS